MVFNLTVIAWYLLGLELSLEADTEAQGIGGRLLPLHVAGKVWVPARSANGVGGLLQPCVSVLPMRQQWWWSWREGSDGDKSQCGRSVLPALPKSKEEKPNLSCVSVITNTEKRVSSCRRLSSTLVSSLDQYSLFHQRAQGSDFALCTTLCSKLWKPVLNGHSAGTLTMDMEKIWWVVFSAIY